MLEGNRAPFVGKFNYNVNGPWAMLRRVRTSPGIVLGRSCRQVRSDAGVVLWRTLVILEDVDEALRHTRA